MDRDDFERREFPPAAQGYDRDTMHEHLRSVGNGLDDWPTAPAERAARDALTKLDALHTELERLLGGLQATAASFAGSLDALGAEPAPLEIPPGPPADDAGR